MDTNTGKLYDSPEDAKKAGVSFKDLVMIEGQPKAVNRVSRAVKRDKHKRDKRLNTPEFNRKAKARREKAKHDAKARKRNQRK